MSDKSPVVIDLKFSRASVAKALQGAFPGRAVIDLADATESKRDLSGANYAVVWKPDPVLFTRMPDLKVLFSGGAGVDHILSKYDLPDVPIVRFVDRSLTDRMSEWVVLQCLIHLRRMPEYAVQQRNRLWHELDGQPEARDVTVGIMGLGVLGKDAASKLKTMGFNVVGWSRRGKSLRNIETYDAAGLDEFLSKTDILVGLLPLTPDTQGIYNTALFSRLRQRGPLGKPIFVNAGRGGSQVEGDLFVALKDGTLGGASLDVFSIEPLSADSPLWGMDNVVITPHAAASSDVHALFRHVEEQIGRFERREKLKYLVDRTSGY